MHARIDGSDIRLLTRTGLDWSHRYQAMIAALRALPVKDAYVDGELCACQAHADPVASTPRVTSRTPCERNVFARASHASPVEPEELWCSPRSNAPGGSNLARPTSEPSFTRFPSI
ncbi:hypothetical protein NKJ01_02975 [Mesorhizobium sp. M0276]